MHGIRFPMELGGRVAGRSRKAMLALYFFAARQGP
jgi:hypothetical protein